MERHGGPAGGVAAFALTAGLACDGGGFDALSWDRALVGLCTLALVLVIVFRGERPGRHAATLLGALALLTAWTAASWLWSDSPPLALEEAQRVALYLTAAAVVVLAGRRVPPVWITAGVVAGATFVALWNLVTRIHGVTNWNDPAAFAQPVGYANSLALLCVLALVLIPLLPRPAVAAVLPLGIVLVLQQSVGAYAALAAGILILAYRRARILVVCIAVIGVVAASSGLHWHERTWYWRVAVVEAEANPVLGSGAGTFRDWWLHERTVQLSPLEAHSLYLETLAELGPIGLTALLAALAAPLAAAVRLRRPELAAALVAYDLGAVIDFHWEVAGVTVPAILIAATAATHTGSRAPVRRVAVVPVLAVLTVAALLAYAGNARLHRAQDTLAAGERARAAALARQALRWAPFSSEAWRVIGDAEASAAAYRRGAELDPHDWSLWQRVAELSEGASRRHALEVAVRLNPLAGGR